MRTTMSWAAPAVLLGCVLGCGQEPPASKPVPTAAPTKAKAAPVAGATLVTLHVPQMV